MNRLVRLLAKVFKKVFGEGFYRRTNVIGHTIEAWVAAIFYGLPGNRLKVIGVTGTNGKTTSINYIVSVLRAAGYKVGASTTANFYLGDEEWDNDRNMTVTDPWSLQRLLRRMKREQVDWVVLEVTSHALHQNRVGGVRFEMAVMTNLSPDHLDYHKTVEEYAAAKAKLLKLAQKVVVLNRDDEWYGYFRDSALHTVYSYGTHKSADIRLEKASLKADSSDIRFRYGERIMNLSLRMPGKFNVYNALAATAVAFGLDIGWKDVERGLKAISGVPGRMEPIHAGQEFAVIVDYAHTPDAFENLLTSLRSTTKGKLITVFGGAPTHDYEGLGKMAGKLSDMVVITDDEPMGKDPDVIRSAIVESAKSMKKAKVLEVADRREGIKKAFAMAKPEDTVALLCLGHQKYRRVGEDERIEWDDRKVARELLKK